MRAKIESLTNLRTFSLTYFYVEVDQEVQDLPYDIDFALIPEEIELDVAAACTP